MKAYHNRQNGAPLDTIGLPRQNNSPGFSTISMASSRTNFAAIAEEAGCSRMTVSRVMRNERYISPEIREKVLNAVKKLGYKPNPMVSAYMSYVRSGSNQTGVGVLAYLTNSPTRGSWRTNSTFSRFYEGAFRRAEQRGFRLEEFWLRERGLSAARISRILHSRGIHGLIVAPVPSAHGHLNLDWKKFSIATIGYSLLKPYLPRASNDQFSSMLIALRELYHLGYRKIAMMLPKLDDERVHYHWSAAYLSFFQRRDLPLPYQPFLPLVWNRTVSTGWVKENQPEAVVSTCEMIHKWLSAEGYRLPQDLGLVNLDWSPRFEGCAGIDQRAEAVGSAAVDLVVDQINRNEFGLPDKPNEVILTGAWVPGATVVRRVETASRRRKTTSQRKVPAKSKG